jgi:hypothetical protein
LALIRSLALLHQHQRPVKTVAHGGREIRYVEATLEDIETANRLAHEVLGRSLDELPPQTRRLLLLIDEMVAGQPVERSEFRFSRKDVRAYTEWGDTQLKVHLHRLEELEYLLVHRGGRGQSFVYELLFESQAAASGRAVLPGLMDVEKLKKSGAGRGQVGPVAGVGRSEAEPMNTGLPREFAPVARKIAMQAVENREAS